jgi:hypothetical protein
MDYDTHLERLASIVSLEPSRSFFGPRKAPSVQVAVPSSPAVASPNAQISNFLKRPKWKPSKSFLQQIISPIIRRLLTRFDEHDNYSKRELRLTLLISHRFNQDGVWNGKSYFSDHHDSDAAPPPNQTNDIALSHHSSSETDEFSRHQTEFFDMYDIWVFGEYLPEIPAPPINVDIIEAERHNPTVKHADWTTERKKLEKEGSLGSNEMLLMDVNGNLYEGLSSNFMVILKGESKVIQGREGDNSGNSEQLVPIGSNSSDIANIGNLNGVCNHEFDAGRTPSETVIMTAPDSKVLSGTIRSLMTQCAREASIPIKYECPNLRDLKAGKWEACAVMSTSRLLLPITSIIVLEASKSHEMQQNGECGGSAGPQQNLGNLASIADQASSQASQTVETASANGSEPKAGLKIEISASDSPTSQSAQPERPTHQHSHIHTEQVIISSNINCDVGDQNKEKQDRFYSENLAATYPLQPTSTHIISAVHTFQPNHPTIALLQHLIARKMLLSATSLATPSSASTSTNDSSIPSQQAS